MKRKRLIWFVALPVIMLLFSRFLAAVLAYRGTYLGEQSSPDGLFTLRYFKSFNPFVMVWSMPGDTACTPK